MFSIEEAEKLMGLMNDYPVAFVLCYSMLTVAAMTNPNGAKVAKALKKKYAPKVRVLIDAEGRLPFTPVKANTDDAHRESVLDTSWNHLKKEKLVNFVSLFVPCRSFCQGTMYVNTIAYRECNQVLENMLTDIGLAKMI